MGFYSTPDQVKASTILEEQADWVGMADGVSPRQEDHVAPLFLPVCPWFFTAMCMCAWTSQVVLVVKNSPANAGDSRDALQYSWMENPMDGGLWSIGS